jgi:hypothetical protein
LGRKEDIKYFLRFLQTVDAGDLRRWISGVDYLDFMYPPCEFEDMSQEEEWAAFASIVSTKQLPKSNKLRHEEQNVVLGLVMNRWVAEETYDPVIDRFLQHLRSIADIAGEDALEAHFLALFPVDRQDEARRHARDMRRLIGRVRPHVSGNETGYYCFETPHASERRL